MEDKEKEDIIPAKLLMELQFIQEQGISCTLHISGEGQFCPYYHSVISHLDEEVIQFSCAEQTATDSTIQKYTYRLELVDGVGYATASLPNTSGMDEGDWNDASFYGL